MTLAARLDKLEVSAAPLVKKATVERKRRNIGKFGTCKLLCYGFTHKEALEILARVNKRKERNIADIPHFTDPANFEFFQSFLDEDAEAARLYSEITANRVEGIGFEETLKDNEQLAAIALQIQERMEAYFLEYHRSDYLNYQAAIEEGKRLLEANNG
jgi:hypothetical protein